MNESKESIAVNNGLQEGLENHDTSNDFQYRDADISAGEETSADDKPSENDVNEANVETDYAELAKKDARELRSEFPELSQLSSVTELDDPIRYGALRDLGLTPREAYLATRKSPKVDNRSHLRPTRSVARGAAPLMTEAEMNAAREIFSGVSDAEIRQLYKRVTK